MRWLSSFRLRIALVAIIALAASAASAGRVHAQTTATPGAATNPRAASAEDEERDRQIAWLRTTVLRLAEDHNRTAAALAMITEPGDTDGEADDLG